MHRKTHEFDDIWRVLKPWGKYQVGQLVLVLGDFIPACFAILSAVFTGYIPEYSCEVPSLDNNATTTVENITFKSHQCHYDVINYGNTSTLLEQRTCNKYSYSKENTYASEWNLVCTRSNLAALAQSLVLAGQGLGALTMSHVADRLGRKTVHIFSHIGVLCSMTVMAFSQNIYMMLILRLVTGTFQQGIVCTAKTLSLEIFPVEIRAHTAPMGSILWSFGLIVLSLIGYIFRDIDWRYLQLALAACSIYALAEWWIVAAGVYYGLTLVSTHLAGDRFLNFFFSGVMEIPPHLLCFFLYNRLGRKKTMILWYALAGVSLVVSTVLLTVLEGNSVAAVIATVFSLLGKAGITGGFSTVFLYTPEIYPTNYRNSGLGIASSISRIGALLSPFASNLALISMWIPGAIFGGLCLLVVILAFRLPESARHELPTTIDDYNQWDARERTLGK